MAKPDDEVDETRIFRCWCGVTGDADEMFDHAVYEQGCGGTGIMQCECGGDICVCHHHGDFSCIGCKDCEADDDDEDYYSDDWDESDD